MHGDGAGRKLSGYICLGGLVMLNTCPTLGTGWMHAWHAPVWGAQTGSASVYGLHGVPMNVCAGVLSRLGGGTGDCGEWEGVAWVYGLE